MKSLETYYRNRGYRPNPLLEDRGDADLTFVKPLPDGRRIHLRIKERRDYLNVEQHIDSSDPGRNPIGHVIKDVLLDEPRHEKFRIKKIKRKKKK